MRILAFVALIVALIAVGCVASDGVEHSKSPTNGTDCTARSPDVDQPEQPAGNDSRYMANRRVDPSPLTAVTGAVPFYVVPSAEHKRRKKDGVVLSDKGWKSVALDAANIHVGSDVAFEPAEVSKRHRLTNLTIVVGSESPWLTVEAWKVLGACQSLRTLSLEVDSEKWAAAMRDRRSFRLKSELLASDNSTSFAALEYLGVDPQIAIDEGFLSRLATLPRMAYVVMGWLEPNPDLCRRQLAALLAGTRMSGLELRGISGAAAGKVIRDSASLRSLVLYREITPEVFDLICESHTLEKLCFWENSCGGCKLEHLRGLKNLKALCFLTSDIDLNQVCLAARPLGTLRELHLVVDHNARNDHHKVGPDGLTALGELVNLESLGLIGVSRSGLEALSSWTKLSHLRRIMLHGPDVTDEALLQLCLLPELAHLVVSAADSITDAGLKNLAKFPKLETLELSFMGSISQEEALPCLVSDDGLAALIRTSPTLRSLSVFNVPTVGSKTAGAVAKSSLEVLSFDLCATDPQLWKVMSGCTTLRTIHLSLEADDVGAATALASTRTLRTLFLYAPDLRPNFLSCLKKLRPDVVVHKQP